MDCQIYIQKELSVQIILNQRIFTYLKVLKKAHYQERKFVLEAIQKMKILGGSLKKRFLQLKEDLKPQIC